MPQPTPEQRKAQAFAVIDLANKWETAANAFDAATVTLEAAQAKSITSARAANEVAWFLLDHSGATNKQKIAALQAKETAEDDALALPPLQAAATDASLARGALELKIDAASDALKDNPGAVEKVA